MTEKSERGQILIIFTVVLVVLLGFTSLAIDVGMAYGDRRYNQSIADTASLAGSCAAAQYLEKNGITYTNFSCTNATVQAAFGVAYDAARSRAANNLVSNLDNNLTDNHGIEVLCVNDPTRFDKHIDVHTKVSSKVPTTFMQFFFGGEVKNTVNAVARIHPRTEIAFGHAIVSLDDRCATKDGGVAFDGNSNVTINGGTVKLTGTTLTNFTGPINASGGATVAFGDNGVVTLRGEVDTEDARKLAMNLVLLEPGVRTVENELTVANAPAPADAAE